MAGNSVTGRLGFERRRTLPAKLGRHRATAGEGTADDLLPQARHQAGNFRQLAATAFAQRRTEQWHRTQQSARVRMQRMSEDFADRCFLHLAPGVHHHDALGHFGDHAEVVRDQHDRRAQPRFQVAHQVEDLRLDRHIQRRGRLIGDQQFRIARQRHRDHHTLTHAAGQLVRILAHAPRRRGNADQCQHVDRLLLGVARVHALMKLYRLADLPADGQHRIQAGHRLLKDHRDRIAADVAHLRFGQSQQVAAFETDTALDLAGRFLDQPQDRHRGDRLAAAGFTDHCQCLAALDVQRHALDSTHHAIRRIEMCLEIFDFEQCHACQSRFASRGSSASRIPSPSRFTASTVTHRNTAGKNTT